MRVFGLLLATFVWILCWVIAPASWWLNERILDEQAFEATMRQVLEIEEVDAQITDQATAGVIDGARDFVGRTVPFLAPQADVLLDRAQPTVSTLVNKAVNSQPGERAMLEASSQVHNVFLAWLDEDTLGQPGLQADLSEGQATFDLDQMLAGEVVTLGPVEVPLDAIDVPGLSVPVPLPPDWTCDQRWCRRSWAFSRPEPPSSCSSGADCGHWRLLPALPRWCAVSRRSSCHRRGRSVVPIPRTGPWPGL
ncbi:MAG: hypothetical protein MUE31_06915 [Candidatus Nanopelagicales bacterium]|nr:hypothetical protein [Candidatus Nanopelagicales bacterium]